MSDLTAIVVALIAIVPATIAAFSSLRNGRYLRDGEKMGVKRFKR
jgi:hypothetical protein